MQTAPLDPTLIDAFGEQGFVIVPDLLDSEDLESFAPHVDAGVARRNAGDTREEERPTQNTHRARPHASASVAQCPTTPLLVDRGASTGLALDDLAALRHCVEQALTHMPGDGAIVTISSAGGMGYVAMMDKIMPLLHEAGHAEGKRWVEAHQGEDWFEPYSFSKACTIAYTLWRGANLTSETGIRLNAISPGPTDTPMMPSFIEHAGAKFMAAYPRSVGRNSTAEEQGWPLAFLNSNAASYISGENLYTDAGTAGGLMTGAVTLDASLMGK